MKTKLVYVLTCSPNDDYIEQALIAVWSARYHNPDVHIVLLTDNLTDGLLTGKRGEVLNYISEKIVISFDNDKNMHYRSRWLKTKVREFVRGNILFVDCDTICCRSIEEIDEFTCEVGAVGDNNTLFKEDLYKDDTVRMVSPLCDISNEDYYYSSGVIYCKDTKKAYELFALWHQFWLEGVTQFGIKFDQPSLAKANIELNHLITPIDGVYNCVLYTQNVFLQQAAILHVSKFPQTSYLFKPKVIRILREQGIVTWLAQLITKCHTTYLPYDYHLKKATTRQRFQWIQDIAYGARMYGKHVDSSFDEWSFGVAIESLIKHLFAFHMYRIGAFLWLQWKFMNVRKKNDLLPNVCAKVL